MASLTVLIYVISVLVIRYKQKEDWFESFVVGFIATAGVLFFGTLALVLGVEVYHEFAAFLGK